MNQSITAPPEGAAPGRAFVTGTTGFLGGHFLYRACRLGGTYFTLARASNDAEGCSRVLANLERCAVSYAEPFDARNYGDHMTAVTGDLLAPSCGLSEARIAELADERIEEFWHFAASLQFEDKHAEQIFEHNVGGTNRALELAKRLGCKRFVYTSTAYTVGSRGGEVKEALHPVEGPFNNVYEQSKCRAEHDVAELCAREGMDFRILRPSIVVGPSTTLKTGGTSTGLYGFYRELFRLRHVLRQLEQPISILGDAGITLNLTPIDHAVSDMLSLRRAGFAGGPIYHLTSPSGPSLGDEIKVLCEIAGVKPISVGDRGDRQPSPLEAVLDMRTGFYGAYLQNDKAFIRSLPAHRKLTLDDVAGYVLEYSRELRADGADSFFERTTVRAEDGTLLCAYAAGDPSSPPLVFANAYGMPAAFFLPLARKLAERFRVITWESRGVPNLAAAFDPARVRLDDHAADLASVIAHYGVTSAHFVGWCTGAQVLLRFAALAPGSVERAVLLNGAYCLPDDVPLTDFQRQLASIVPHCARAVRNARVYSDIIYGARQLGGEDRQRSSDARVVSSLLAAVDFDVLHMTSAPYRTAEALHRYATLLHKLEEEPRHAWASEVNVPVLVVTATCDTIAHPEASRSIARRLSQARLIVKEGDHFLLYSDPQLASQIIDFFQEPSGLPPSPVTAPASPAGRDPR